MVVFLYRKKNLTLLILLGLSLIKNVFAFSIGCEKSNCHPIFSLSSGLALASNLGSHQSFPAEIPTTYEIFNYTANAETQTSALFDTFLGIEWNLLPNASTQIGFNYHEIFSFAPHGTFVQGVDLTSANSYAYHYRILARQLLAEGKILFLMNHIYHPYVFAGVGSAFNKTYQYTTTVPPFLTFTRMYRMNTASTFSYALGIGIDVDVYSYMRIGVGYRFADAGEIQLGSALIDTKIVNGTLSQLHLYTHEFFSTLTFLV